MNKIYTALVLIFTGLAVLHGGEKVNFVLIMADDLGFQELGCYGNTDNRTPHLDRLAAGGMRFRTCYATHLCTPSRVEIMTGRYGFRTGWLGLIRGQYSPQPDTPQYDIGAQEVTFADLLKQAGYATAVVGKWQLPGSPEKRIYDCGFDEYCMWMWRHELPGDVKHTGAYEIENKTERFWHPGVMVNGKYRPTSADDYGPDIYTDFAIDFIRRHRHRPFCVYYPMCLVHDPWHPTPNPENPGEKTPGGFKYNVEYMDHLVGKITAVLAELGLRKNTLLVFTGDNGTKGKGKGTLTESGVHVPLIVNQPGFVPKGVVSDELIDVSDILPTFAELAGTELPQGRAIDGKSMVRTIRGEKVTHREWIFSFFRNQKMLRNKRWLLDGNDRFYDCGDSRNGEHYRDVTESTAPEVNAARRRFAKILQRLFSQDSNE